MKQLLNVMANRAAQSQAGFTGTRQGIITGYDAAEYCIKATLQPTGEETGWIPLATIWAGNGWGLCAGPMVGAEVEINFDSGLIGAGMASGQFYNNEDRCPGPPSGELWIVHQSGAFFKLLNSGAINIQDKTGSLVALNGDGTGIATFSGGLTINANTQINGDLTVSGSIKDQNGSKGTVQHIRDIYDSHDHGGVQTGSGNTATPNQPL